MYKRSVSVQYAISPSANCINLGLVPTLILTCLTFDDPSSTSELLLSSVKKVPGLTSSIRTEVSILDTSLRISFTVS